MNRVLNLNPLLLGGALIALAAEPGVASVTSITGVRVNPTDAGLELILEARGGDASNVFTVSQGNTLRADITRAQLNLPDGNGFTQANPAPGIAEVSVVPLDANSVRVTINGNGQAPTGTVSSSGNQVVVSVRSDGQAAQPPTPVPTELETVPAPEAPPATAQATPPADATPATPPAQANPDILVPDPEVTIDGQPVPQPRVQQAPPFLPRAVAPPVGDIAVAESQVIADAIDLGSNERIPRLLLREASAREVLSLLARSAGLNIVFTADNNGSQSNQAAGPTVSLDIENESVQDVFNHVLRVTGLQANRVGRSIYVSPRLPDAARNLVSRTLRLNQVDAGTASAFLGSLGAEATRTVERTQIERNVVEGGDGLPDLISTREFTTTEIEPLTYNPEGDSAVARPLQGLQVVSDDRLNSVTIIGEARLVALATEYLTRLDLRRRQVAVNVKVIDINLSALDAFGTSFSFQTGNFGIVSSGGLGVVNLGVGIPSTPGISSVPGSTPIGPTGLNAPTDNQIANNFLFQLLATVQSGNGKIITDPTLIVQEGQTATVALTTDIVERIVTTFVDTPAGQRETREPQISQAGLTLLINVTNIDDNGFVTFNVSPSISSPVSQVDTGDGGFVTLLTNREIQSGNIRVRDGQTLLLSGIIQESERSSVTKVPILGDIPILGALFRSTVTDNQRQELIVLVTPQILDDSDQSVWGYSYTPSEEVQNILENRQR